MEQEKAAEVECNSVNKVPENSVTYHVKSIQIIFFVSLFPAILWMKELHGVT